MLIVSKESTLLILSLSKPLIRPQDFLLCSKHQLSELTVAVSVPFYHVAVSQGLGTTEFTNLIALQPSSCQILPALGKSLFLFFFI